MGITTVSTGKINMIGAAERPSTENIWKNNRHNFSEFAAKPISQDPKTSISLKGKWNEKGFAKSHQNQTS